jgi:hypothetical protein
MGAKITYLLVRMAKYIQEVTFIHFYT